MTASVDDDGFRGNRSPTLNLWLTCLVCRQRLLHLLLHRVADAAVAANIAEVREESRGGDQQAEGQEQPLRALLVARHLPEADRHQEGCDRGKDGERREAVAVDAARGAHVPGGGSGDADGQDGSRKQA